MNSQQPIDFKALFEGAPGLFLALSPNLTLLAMSDAYTAANLIRKETKVGDNFFDVFPNNPNDSKYGIVTQIRASLEYVLQNKITHIMPVIRLDVQNTAGVFEEKYWNPINKPILNKDNEIQYIFHSIKEVTEFVELEKIYTSDKDKPATLNEKIGALKSELFHRSQKIEQLNQKFEQKIIKQSIESEHLAKDILDYKVALDAADIVAITDQKGTIQYANDNFCKISKYTKEELIGQNHRIVNSGYHEKSFFNNLWQTIGSGSIWKGEIKNKAKDGTVYWVDTTIVPFLNEKGKPYKYLAIRSDITERKLSEEALKQSEEQYRDIFSNALVAILTMDVATSKVTAVNNVGVELFGYDSKEDLLKNFSPINHYVHPNEYEDNMIILIEHGERRNIQHMKRKDGSLFWTSIFVKVNEAKTTTQTILLDVTSQIAFQEELETKVAQRTFELTESLAREKELNEMKSNFLGIASHEFRTPLGTILSSTSLLKKYTESNQQELVTKHLDRISGLVNHLNAILNDFLTLEKLRKGFIDFEVNEFNLPDFITETISEIEALAKLNDQSIHYSHTGESYINQSSKILKNILLNLLSNASKYSEHGKEIQIESQVNESTVTISIQDHGIGIPFKDQKKLFSEFYRASNAKNIQGTGLGLAIVKNYIALLEGSISFNSRERKGTVFTLSFPRYLSETLW
ncbi:sensor histidine kinase [Flavobacterium sp. UBA7682]|uniref:sensor histidine kinase n=1 Tax=Flavobacterium sp. UBA7682 TaxID=1946560 RepID=UPI0025C51E95|nr:PAS domain-containing sensor histidine kinase [Flavobacterium sp. UBA7682]